MPHPITVYVALTPEASYAKIARSAGISRSMISKIVSGEVFPSLETAAKISAACNKQVSVAEIINPRIRDLISNIA